MKHRPTFVIYAGLFAFTTVIAILSLSLNIKTVSINKEISKLSRELRQLKERNEAYSFQFHQRTQLHHVVLKAQDMSMVTANKTVFIPVPKTKETPH